jgi:hypothetical protein
MSETRPEPGEKISPHGEKAWRAVSNHEGGLRELSP